ncbi:hypothetical protein WA158_002640 [Blastocystis sp. Blastoise]
MYFIGDHELINCQLKEANVIQAVLYKYNKGKNKIKKRKEISKTISYDGQTIQFENQNIVVYELDILSDYFEELYAIPILTPIEDDYSVSMGSPSYVSTISGQKLHFFTNNNPYLYNQVSFTTISENKNNIGLTFYSFDQNVITEYPSHNSIFLSPSDSITQKSQLCLYSPQCSIDFYYISKFNNISTLYYYTNNITINILQIEGNLIILDSYTIRHEDSIYIVKHITKENIVTIYIIHNQTILSSYSLYTKGSFGHFIDLFTPSILLFQDIAPYSYLLLSLSGEVLIQSTINNVSSSFISSHSTKKLKTDSSTSLSSSSTNSTTINATTTTTNNNNMITTNNNNISTLNQSISMQPSLENTLSTVSILHSLLSGLKQTSQSLYISTNKQKVICNSLVDQYQYLLNEFYSKQYTCLSESFFNKHYSTENQNIHIFKEYKQNEELKPFIFRGQYISKEKRIDNTLRLNTSDNNKHNTIIESNKLNISSLRMKIQWTTTDTHKLLFITLFNINQFITNSSLYHCPCSIIAYISSPFSPCIVTSSSSSLSPSSPLSSTLYIPVSTTMSSFISSSIHIYLYIYSIHTPIYISTYIFSPNDYIPPSSIQSTGIYIDENINSNNNDTKNMNNNIIDDNNNNISLSILYPYKSIISFQSLYTPQLRSLPLNNSITSLFNILPSFYCSSIHPLSSSIYTLSINSISPLQQIYIINRCLTYYQSSIISYSLDSEYKSLLNLQTITQLLYSFIDFISNLNKQYSYSKNSLLHINKDIYKRYINYIGSIYNEFYKLMVSVHCMSCLQHLL